MLVRKDIIVGETTQKVNNYFDTFKSFILDNLFSSWNKEDLTGKSYAQWRSFIYFKMMYLFLLIDRDIKRNPTELWGYFEAKYNLNKIVACINCNVEFSYSKAKTAFGFDMIPITTENQSKSVYDLDFLSKNSYICLSILESGDFDVESYTNQDIFNLSSNGNNIIIIGGGTGDCNFDAIKDTIDNNNGNIYWDSLN